MSDLMLCGHVANAHHSGTILAVCPGAGVKGEHPSCILCMPDPAACRPAHQPSLEGRMAHCGLLCGTERPSNWGLPFFEYCGPGSRQDDGQDRFYCGCQGWD